MDQEPLFHERIEDAIAAVVDRLGRKKVAGLLWPDKIPRDAHNLIDACLNPERKERLSPTQLMFVARLGRDAGLHGIATFMCRELGYADPEPIEPEDEARKLQREFMEGVKRMEGMAKRLEQLQPYRLVREA
jgi:hypothetical protein